MPVTRSEIWLRRAKPVLFCALALPLALLGVDVWRELQAPGSAFGPDPAAELVHRLGAWALRMLLLALAVSPLARLLRQPRLVRVRRMVGLWAFAYAVLHFMSYLGPLAGFALATVIEDLAKRPYITVGFAALVALVPLAVTSTRGWQRRLRQRWKKLHRLVYPAAIAAWLHLLWLSKGSTMDPFIYGVVLALLFGERIAHRMRGRKRAAAAAGRAE